MSTHYEVVCSLKSHRVTILDLFIVWLDLFNDMNRSPVVSSFLGGWGERDDCMELGRDQATGALGQPAGTIPQPHKGMLWTPNIGFEPYMIIVERLNKGEARKGNTVQRILNCELVIWGEARNWVCPFLDAKSGPSSPLQCTKVDKRAQRESLPCTQTPQIALENTWDRQMGRL